MFMVFLKKSEIFFVFYAFIRIFVVKN